MKLARISADELPELNRLAVLREVYGRIIIKHDFEPIGERPLRFGATLLSAPDLGVASAHCSPARFVRRFEHIDSDDFVLNVILRGGRFVRQLDREVIVGQGEAILTTCAERGAVTIECESRYFSVRVPRIYLEASVADLDSCLLQPIRRGNRGLQLLTSYLVGLQATGAFTSAKLREHILAHIHDLIWATLGSTRDASQLAQERGIRAARLLAIKRDILENLGDASLSPSTISIRHAITPRYVHKLFEDEGMTVSAFVIEHRLALAYRMLCDPALLGSKIHTIASQSGFTDLSWFNRMFRRRYGATPSDIREAALRRRR